MRAAPATTPGRGGGRVGSGGTGRSAGAVATITTRFTPSFNAGLIGVFSRIPPSAYHAPRPGELSRLTAGKAAGFADDPTTCLAVRVVGTYSMPRTRSVSIRSGPPSTNTVVPSVEYEVPTTATAPTVPERTLSWSWSQSTRRVSVAWRGAVSRGRSVPWPRRNTAL